IGDLRHGDAQRHLLLVEIDDKELQSLAGDLARFDARDLADAVGRINDKVAGAERQFHRHLFSFRLLIYGLHRTPYQPPKTEIATARGKAAMPAGIQNPSLTTPAAGIVQGRR